MRTLVITESENEVQDLHRALGKEDMIEETRQPGFYTDFYNGTWFWIVEGDSLVGTSGNLSINGTIRRNPGIRAYMINDFIKELENGLKGS